MGGHSGETGTYYKVAAQYFWAGMKGDISEYVSTMPKSPTT